MIRVVFSDAARAEVREAADWYHGRAVDLERRLLDELQRVVNRIAHNPLQFPVVHRELRRAGLRRFPYGLYFLVDDDHVEILACLHASRRPRQWRGRLEAD